MVLMGCQVWDVFAFSLSEEHEFHFTLHKFAKFPAFTNCFLPYQARGDQRAPRERAQPVRAEKSRTKNQKITLNGNRLLRFPLIFGKKKKKCPSSSQPWGLCGLHEAPVVLVPLVPSHAARWAPQIHTCQGSAASNSVACLGTEPRRLFFPFYFLTLQPQINKLIQNHLTSAQPVIYFS